MLKRRAAEEDSKGAGGKLQAVFSKLSGVMPRAQELGAAKTMSSDIIESVLVDNSPVLAPTHCTFDVIGLLEDKNPLYQCLSAASLTRRLENELREAKRTHLSCGQVLLPCGLLQRIARDIFSMAESEPYGIRGSLIYLNYESVDECRKLGSIKCDPSTATTFELNLTLKQSASGWTFIPQFLKNFASRSSGTIVVSQAYVLSKKKLYRSALDL